MSSDRFIDPEPLIPFSLHVAREDPRVFDEILAWLVKNGKWIHVGRLLSILRKDCPDKVPLLQAVAATVTGRQPHSRWKRLVSARPEALPEPEPLFFLEGRPWDPQDHLDPIFLRYGFKRNLVSVRSGSREVAMANPCCIAFRIRSLFGVSVRSEVLTCLVIRGKGHPSGISRLLGLSQKQVQDTLVEMAHSGLVHVRRVGRRKDYWVDPEKWCPFLLGQEVSPVQWVHWRALTRGLRALWTVMSRSSAPPASDYVLSSMARRAMRSARDDLLDSGIGIKLSDDRPHHAEAYLDVFIQDVRGIVGRLQA